MLSLYLSMVETDEQRSLVEDLYIKYEQYMYKSAFEILHNKHDAEDAVHNCFIRIVENIDKVMQIERSKLKSYIVIMIKNCAIDIYRKKKKEVIVDTDDESTIEQADSFDIEQELQNRIDRDVIKKAISSINEDQQNILIMRYYLDMDIGGIAKSLDVSYDAARKRLDRAKSSIAKFLSEDFNDGK